MAGMADAQAVGKTTGHRTTFHGEDYFFAIFELAYQSSVNSARGLLNGTVRVGLWNDPQPKSHSDTADTQRDDWGWYVSADHMLINENPVPTDTQGLGMFFRVGHANDQRNDLAEFISLGLHYQGLWQTRDLDVLSLGMAQGTFSDQARQTYTRDHERVTELYYKAIVSDHLHMSPMIQYISNPGGTQASRALVAAIRAQIDFK
jgi:carbohydrate-selective porin OprB